MAPVIPDTYIDPGGSDTTGDGTITLPYATLAKALERLPDDIIADVTIHIADGTYLEPIEIRRFKTQSPKKIKLEGNTTTPTNVNFTGTVNDDSGSACGALITGEVTVELEGLRINVTASYGLRVYSGADVQIDRCTITGTLVRAIYCQSYVSLTFYGDVTISGWTANGIRLLSSCQAGIGSAGTLTLTGPVGSGWGMHIFGDSQFITYTTDADIMITGVQIGFQLGLYALFQHLGSSSVITVDNAATPASSAGVQSTDLSSWSTNQTVTMDHLTLGFEANSISYIEAAGTRNLTNLGGTSSATQNSVIYLP